MRLKNLYFILSSMTLGLSPAVYGQLSQYVSPVDRSLTFDEIAVMSFDDNTQGAYSKPLMKAAEDFFEKDRRYHATPFDKISKPLIELELESKSLQDDAKTHPRRAYLKTQVIKGLRGLSIRTALFTGSPTRPLFVLEKNEGSTFELSTITQDYLGQLSHLVESLPYQARVLSRRGNQVTMNAGSLQGLKKNQDVLIVQVIQIERHPQLQFATQFHREIMGKVRLSKVDESLSFGEITFEKTASLIAPDFKVTLNENVSYAPAVEAENVQMWRPPTIGEVKLLGGFSKLNAQNRLVTSGSVSSDSSLTPTVLLGGEVWFTQNWFSQIQLQQYVTQLNNGLSGSTPSTLNAQVLRTSLVGGYHFLLNDDFWGTRLKAGLGYSKTRFSISDSAPTSLTSLDYSSVAFVLGGKFPIEVEGGKRWYLGLDFQYHLNVGLSESPVSSSSGSSSKIANVDFSVDYPWRENVWLTGHLQFDQFNTNFSGSGGSRSEAATSASLNFLTVLGGVVLQF